MLSISDLSSTLNTNDSSSYSTESDLIVLIEQDKAKRFYIQFINSKGYITKPNISLFRGEKRALVEEYLNILSWNQYNFSWGAEQTDFIYCDENPDFIRRLFCSDFPIWFGKQKKLLTLAQPDSNDENNTKFCQFFLKISQNTEEKSILDLTPTLEINGNFEEKILERNQYF